MTGDAVEFHPVPPERAIAAAARRIIELERERLPGLNAVTVLLPSLHAASGFGRALGEAAGAGALLLPRFATLKQLAGEIDAGRDCLPDSRRQAMIHQALRDRHWFGTGELWQVGAELLRLFDELSLSLNQLPDSEADFLRQLELAYRTRRDSALEFEARLVHEFWHAMTGGEPDGVALYRLQLARLANEASAPLYLVGHHDLAPLELAFLDAYARRQPVRWFRPGPPADDAAPPYRLLHAAWNEPDDGPPPLERAAGLRAGLPSSPLAGRLHLHAAHGLEQEATLVASQVGQWLAQGKNTIAVVAQDRLVARRARALLERLGVLVADETGWTLSTTSASTVLMRWLDCLDSQFHHQDLLDLLKSPFMLAGADGAARRAACFRLEQLIRGHGVVSHLKRYRMAASGDGEIIALLGDLEAARKALDKRRARPLAAWQQDLLASLETLGLIPGLERDPAGAQVLQRMEALRRELARDDGRFSYGEWRQWLNQQLETAVFRDESIDSPVVFTHLAACHLRSFDAVIIAGADAAHLPAQARENLFFNQAVRAQLGLPGRQAARATERRDLLELLLANPEVRVTWQAFRHGEPNLLSPWFERLDIFHRMAYGTSLRAADAPLSPALNPAPATDIPATRAPAPALPERLVPATVSASAYNSLVACPYQFFARHALHLNELDEVAQTLEKRDYGEYIHDILHRFHQSWPRLSGHPRAELERALADISAAVFARAIAANFVSHAWHLRWQAAIPGYVSWQLAREREGWRHLAGELERTLTLELEQGRTLTLRGRLDRVDAGENGTAVLDYKTLHASSLKKKLTEPGEDVQLPCYALLLGDMPRQAAFVAVDGEETQQVEAEGDIATLAAANRERLQTLFEAMHRDAPLPAQGTQQACGYCEMRGLCRKDYWHD